MLYKKKDEAQIEEEAEKESKRERRRERRPIRKIEIISTKGLFIIAVTVLVLAGGFFVANKRFDFFKSKEGEVITISKATLEKVLESSQLSTLEYKYNAVATVNKELFTNTTKYYVAYEGTVKAGIDFKKIDIQVDDETRVITIKLPEVEIQEINVKAGSLKYIFTDEEYETETIAQEALVKCEEDLTERAGKEEKLLEMARENALYTIKALIEPWVKQVDASYEIVYE